MLLNTYRHSNCINLSVNDCFIFKCILIYRYCFQVTNHIIMNSDKLKKLQSQVRIGGKGTPRRKKKVVHATAANDDKKLESSLKKLSLNAIPGIEEVNMIKDDGTVIHFNNPKAKASLAANTFVITGHGENKQIAEMLPGILTQLSPEGLNHLKRLATGAGPVAPKSLSDDLDDVPNLIGNFDEASKQEVAPKVEPAPPKAAASPTPAPAAAPIAAGGAAKKSD